MRAADAAGVRLGCAPDTFLGGGIQTAIKLLDDGWLGDIITGGVAMVTEHGYETCTRRGSFYRPGGGPLLDLGPYYVTALVAMLGPVARVTQPTRATFPERTSPVGPRRGERIAVEVPTHVTGALEFERGALVTLLVSWDVWATHLPVPRALRDEGSLAVANPDEFDGEPRLRRAGREELEQPPPPPGTVPWYADPARAAGDVGRGIGVADMALALREERPTVRAANSPTTCSRCCSRCRRELTAAAARRSKSLRTTRSARKIIRLINRSVDVPRLGPRGHSGA